MSSLGPLRRPNNSVEALEGCFATVPPTCGKPTLALPVRPAYSESMDARLGRPPISKPLVGLEVTQLRLRSGRAARCTMTAYNRFPDLKPPSISPSTSFLLLHTAEIGDTIVEYSPWHSGTSEDRVRLVFDRAVAVRDVPEHLSEASGLTDVGELPESSWLSTLHKEQRGCSQPCPSTSGAFVTTSSSGMTPSSRYWPRASAGGS